MNVKIPDFRNLLTTGNIVSACSALVVGATAWANVQADLRSNKESVTEQKKSIERLETSDNAARVVVSKIQQDVAVIINEQSNQAKSLARIEEWMRLLSRQNSGNGSINLK